jgi:uncharacterized protein YdeI (YjbR/CyaY-like superfamily)
VELSNLLVANTEAWHDWLLTNHNQSKGVRLVLAKKDTIEPTSLTYNQALEEAICFGWIDGQVDRRDATTYLRRFTPRKPRSAWSQRNTKIAEELATTGRMHFSGAQEVTNAKEDGRWASAYAGQASIEIPVDLASALRARPRAQAMFEVLTSQNRYAVLYRIGNAKRAETRTKRITHFVDMLDRGETIYPQSRTSPD